VSGVWQTFQECGFPSYVCLLTSLLAITLSCVSLVFALLGARVVVVLAWLAVTASLLPVGVGAIGMVWGRLKVERALDTEAIEPQQRERIRHEGNREAAGCVALGGVLSGPPVALAAVALALAYTRRRPG
jgi:hypothetical protein